MKIADNVPWKCEKTTVNEVLIKGINNNNKLQIKQLIIFSVLANRCLV